MIILFVVIGCVNNISANEAITNKNWLVHPKIKEIRQIYKDISKLNSEDKLNGRYQNYEYCEPYEDTRRELLTERNGTPRYYYQTGGSEDSAVSWHFYYDGNGNLRFALIEAGAVNNTKIEHRIYFNQKGERIWEIQKKLEGPGYTFPRENWPLDPIIYNPIGAFESANKCKKEWTIQLKG